MFFFFFLSRTLLTERPYNLFVYRSCRVFLILTGSAAGYGERQALLRVLRLRHHCGQPAQALACRGQRFTQPQRHNCVRPRHEGIAKRHEISPTSPQMLFRV